MAVSNLLYRISIVFFVSMMAFGVLDAQPVLQYPREPLPQRLQRISRDFQIHISFDHLLLNKISCPAAIVSHLSAAPDAILQISLERTGFTYRKQDTRHYIIKQLKKGSISGVITDAEDGTPLNGVSIEAGTHRLATSKDGLFELAPEEGIYTILLSAVGYETKEIPGISVVANRAQSLHFTLQKKPLNLPVIRVMSSITAEAIRGHYAKQKQQASIADGLVAPQIRAMPDKHLSQVLRRINGINAIGNSAGIRGLGERYSHVMVDGISLPSFGMNRRALNPDLLPKELVREIIVVKTAVPDMPGDFAGGQIQIQSLAIPDQDFTSLTLEAGGNNQSIFRITERLGDKGKSDWLGADDGTRKKPAGIRSWQWNNKMPQPPPGDATGTLPLIPGETPLYHSLNAKEQSRSVPAGGLSLQKGITIPDFYLSFSMGRSYALNPRYTLGWVWGTAIYQQGVLASFYNWRRSSATTLPDSLKPSHQGPGTQSTTLSGSGTVFNLGVKSKTFQVRLNNLFSTQLKDEFSTSTRRYPNKGQQRHFQEFFQQPEQSIFQQHQMEMEKQVTPYTSIHYLLAYNSATHHLLDRRHLQYFQTGSSANTYNTPNILYNWRQNNDSNIADNRTWIDANEQNYISGLSVVQRLIQSAAFSASLKSGWVGTIRNKTFSVLRLLPYSNAAPGIVGSYFDLLQPSSNTDVYYWAENTNGKVFSGRLRNQAFYLSIDQSFLSRMRLYYGIRAEYYHMRNDQQIFLRRLHNGLLPPQFGNGITGEKTWNLLPSIQAIFSIHKKMHIRSAFSKTVSRPEFRETAYFGLYDYQLDATINGRQLISTLINNYDFRWAWFPSPAEIVSLSVFHKQLRNPVELALAAPFPNSYGYINQHSAQTSGIEIEVRKSLKFIAPQSFLKKVVIQSAYTANWSKVAIMSYPLLASGAFTQQRMPAQDRPLFNQVPWSVNASLLYETPKAGISVFYNKTGPKTFTTHINPNLVEYENGLDELDAGLYLLCFGNSGRINLTARNLTNQWRLYYRNTKAYQQKNGVNWELVNGTTAYNPGEGDTLTYRIRQGMNVNIGFAWKF